MKEKNSIDDTDRRILAEVQRNAALSLAELADKVGLSSTPCWRRVQRLEKAGILSKRVALLDPDALNLGVTVFVRLKTDQHDRAWLDRFAAGVVAIPEVVEVWRMSGEIDYLLKVVVPDIAGYDAVYKRLIAAAPFADVSSNFAMERIKVTTELPLDYA